MFSISSFVFGSSIISGAFGWVSAFGLAKKLRVAEHDNTLLKKRNKKLTKSNKQLRKDFYELGNLAAKALDDMSEKNPVAFKKSNFIEIVIDLDTIESIEQLSDAMTSQINEQIDNSDEFNLVDGISVDVKFVKGGQSIVNICICAHITSEIPEKEVFDAIFKTLGLNDLFDTIHADTNEEDDDQSDIDNKNDFDKNINIVNEDMLSM